MSFIEKNIRTKISKFFINSVEATGWPFGKNKVASIFHIMNQNKIYIDQRFK